jgi:hypothetical protein
VVVALSIGKISSPEFQPVALSGVFSSPSATFVSLKQHPRWFCPLLITAVYSVMVNFYVIHRIGFVRLLSATLRTAAAIDAQGVLETALERKAQILFFQGLSTFVSIFFTAFVVAKVLWLVLEVIGEDLPFKRVLAVVAHTTMMMAIIRDSMLAFTATLMRNPENLDLSNPLATNLAFFLHPGSPLAHRSLASLDVLTLAKLYLLGLGLNKVSERLSPRTACVVVLVPWGVYVGASFLLPGLP